MANELIDTHTHLQFDAFDEDRDAVIRRALEKGIVALVTLATDCESSYRVIELAEKHSQVYAAVGIHPTDAAAAKPDDLQAIAKLARHPRVVAVGEIGMDFYWDASTASVQEKILLPQLELAAELDLPVVIHNRRAGQALLKLLDQVRHLPLRGVFHCFSEDQAFAEEVLRRGFYISFTGNLTYKKSRLPEVAKAIPLEKMLLETDSPFMAPVPMRGKRNEPAFVRFIAEKHAEIRSISVEQVATITTENAKTLFNL